ncbi:MAG: hypothetical protein IBV52_03195 [Candidatus Bathyarchaeota archaeon]
MFNAVMITVLILFSVVAVSNPAILEIPYVPYLVAAMFIVFTISTVAFISGFLRASRKWGLILIAIAIIIAVLHMLVRNL